MLKRTLFQPASRLLSAFAIIFLVLGVVPANPAIAKPISPPHTVERQSFQPVDTPVGFWKFDEGSGAVASDSSGFGNNGVVSGATWTGGQVNGALLFNGSIDRVEVPGSSSLSLDTNQATIAAWVRADTTTANWATLIQRSNTAGNWLDWQIYARAIDAPTANHPVCRFNWDGNNTIAADEQVQGDIVLQPNTWYFLACTYDGTALRFYIDGTLRGTTAAAGRTILNSGKPVWIGGNDIWGEYYDGIIDEARIYNRALSGSEIQALMLQYTLTITAANGTVTKNPNRTNYSYDEIVQLTAAPDPGWEFTSWSGDLSGNTNPTSIVMDGNKNVTATFTLLNNQPTTSGIADVNVAEDAADTVIDLWPSFADVEDPDSALAYTVTNNTNAALFTSVAISGGQNLTLDYAPNQNGTADITVRATDTAAQWVEATFKVTISTVNDTPTTSGIANVNVAEDAPNTVIDLWPSFADVEDADGSLTYTVENNTNAALFTSVTVSAGQNLVLDYAPGQSGTTDITMRATDTGGLWVETTFRVSVGAVNDPPSVSNLNNDTIAYTENDPPTPLDVGGDAVVTDSDSANFDGGSLTVQFFSNGSPDDRLAIQNACGIAPNDISVTGGNVYINGGSVLLGSFTGGAGTTPLVVNFGANATPATVDYMLRCITFENVSNTPSTLQRVVRFNVSDGDGGTSANDFTYVNFTAFNDAPVAVGETYATDMDMPLVVAAPGVLANDTDPEGSPLAAVKDTEPANGTVILNPDGSFTYTPNPLFTGIDSFTYHASDGAVNSNIVTVNIGVEAPGSRFCGSGIFVDKGWEFIFPDGSLPGCIYINADDGDPNDPNSGSLESLGHRIQVFAYSSGKLITKLNLPYEVCFTPNADDLKKVGGNFALLRIGVFSNGGSNWELLPVTNKNGKACTSLDHFSHFDLFRVALPATGFAPDVVTPLPKQTVEYAPLGDLWLEIPRLGIQQAIVGVPLTENGWDVTWLADQIGYLYGTAYPTGAGNSVLTAHVYDSNGKPGTFASLKSLWWGDQVIVHSFGQKYVYEVRQVVQTGWDSAASVLKHEEYSWITLVTCKDYNEATNSYRSRVVVRAVLVEVK